VPHAASGREAPHEADDVVRIAALDGRSFSDVEEELRGFLPFAES